MSHDKDIQITCIVYVWRSNDGNHGNHVLTRDFLLLPVVQTHGGKRGSSSPWIIQFKIVFNITYKFNYKVGGWA